MNGNLIHEVYDEVLCAASMPQSKNGKSAWDEDNSMLQGGTSDLLALSVENPMAYYPNPNVSFGQLTIAYELTNLNNAQLNIYNMMGQKVQELTIDPEANRVSFQLANLSVGMYKLEIVQEGGVKLNGKLSIRE